MHMTTPRYIGPHDVPVIRAAVQRMLQEGMPRAEIATRLMAEYVPHDDVARLIARFPLADAVQRYRHWHHVFFGLTLLVLAWYACTLIFIGILCIYNPTITQFVRSIIPFFMAASYVGVLSMIMLKSRRYDGVVYHLGVICGAVVFFDCISGAIDGHMLVKIVFSGMALAGVAMSCLSFFLGRRLFPDLKLFSAPRKDEHGRYIFTESADSRTGA